MCVLPAKSAGEALPKDLANLVVIAQEMEDGPAPAITTSDDAAGGRRRPPSSGGGGGARANGRRRSRGGGGGGGAFALLDAASESDDDEEEGASSEGSEESDGDDGDGGAAAPEFAGDMALSAMLLAEQLRRAFPSEIEPLVDLSGGHESSKGSGATRWVEGSRARRPAGRGAFDRQRLRRRESPPALCSWARAWSILLSHANQGRPCPAPPPEQSQQCHPLECTARRVILGSQKHPFETLPPCPNRATLVLRCAAQASAGGTRPWYGCPWRSPLGSRG
jgi:hypothetical protein